MEDVIYQEMLNQNKIANAEMVLGGKYCGKCKPLYSIFMNSLLKFLFNISLFLKTERFSKIYQSYQ